jgi:hypothetical protein
VSGTCPTITFVLKNETFYTTSSTVIKKGPCKDIKREAEISVDGWLMSDGRIRCDEITIRDDD